MKIILSKKYNFYGIKNRGTKKVEAEFKLMMKKKLESKKSKSLLRSQTASKIS